MALYDPLGGLWRWRGWWPARRRARTSGDTGVAEARRLADAERRGGEVPHGCAWLDERTVDDTDLPLVFDTIDRTVTPTGAQALWRWLAAPAVDLEVLAARERALARLAADPDRRERIRDALGAHAISDAPHLPRLLWEAPPPPVRIRTFAALAVALVALIALATWWTPLWIGVLALGVANAWIDEHTSAHRAAQARALEVLGQVMASADRVIARGLWSDAAIAADLAAFAGLRARVAWLTTTDPFGILDVLRAALFLRVLSLGRWSRVVARERARLRRMVLWVGELDALASIATLRAERADARVPDLVPGAPRLVASALVHPAIAGAVGNDLSVDAGLIVTGSNMSGKSTFLRTIAINAICAQSIHTTFGAWRAGLFRVWSVMRIADATADGQSTYAVEVDAIGALVAAVTRRDHGVPALLIIDEPFRGTNPALRVPIVVSVLDHCATRDVVIAATHDLDVAAQVDARFARGYFAEPDATTGRFDRRLRPGVSPASNALAMLVRAGYPPAIIAAVEARAGVSARAAAARPCPSTRPDRRST